MIRYKYTVVSDSKFEDWVLGGNSRDIYSRLKGQKKRFVIDFDSGISRIYSILQMLFSRNLIFVNQNTYYRQWFIISTLKILRINITILYTHTNSRLTKQQISLLNKCDKIVLLNTIEKELLHSSGILTPRIVVQPTGVDFNKFNNNNNSQTSQRVLVVSAFASRKNPYLLFDVISQSPDFNFLLIGKGWDKFERFHELAILSNFNYETYNFESYVEKVNSCNIFLSLSLQEGGPLPLLEAMACGLVPIATPVGYACDVIIHGSNGYILSQNPTPKEIREYLLQAEVLHTNTRSSIEELTYEAYLSQFE
jgi:glycosyltransferase involved in cell wall biosynthesis